jgi:hypothetical protein
VHVQIATGLRNTDAALLDQPNRLDLELPTEYQSRHNNLRPHETPFPGVHETGGSSVAGECS